MIIARMKDNYKKIYVECTKNSIKVYLSNNIK